MSNDPPHSDATLAIAPQAGGKVYLYDPIEVNQLDMNASVTGSATNRAFLLQVAGAGDFFWGGDNVFKVGDYDGSTHQVSNIVELQPGSRTHLMAGMSLDAPKHDFLLKPGGYLAPGINGDGTLNSFLKINSAKLGGTVHFALNVDFLNDKSKSLLEIQTAAGKKVDISGSTISLGDFVYSGDLGDGDMFYLLDAKDYGQIEGTPQNSSATAMKNLAVEYTFLIDTEAADNEPGKGGRKLVARLASVAPAPQTKALTEGYAAGLVFLSHIGSWLPDYSYYTAELAIRKPNAWQAFSGFDASSFKAITGSYVKVQGLAFVLGAAAKYQNPMGSFLFGGFVEGGVSDYKVVTDVVTSDLREVGGNGVMRSLGFGLMASQKFENGFRVETTFRHGVLKNDFVAENYVSASGAVAKYSLVTPYYGAHLALAYTQGLGDYGSLDYSVKYYYSRLAGKTLALGHGDKVSYKDTNSHRVRAGIRYSKPFTESLALFAGAHFDHEFDNMARATVYGMDVKTAGIKGSSGIFELGATVRPKASDHLSFEFGVQAYAGTFRGASGGIRVGYEF
ncbi:MAG: autotransporter outer membrane beta-barrel domain-containing protein [Deltaproteobacteria bacterium]|nr:autotransporter outer membrane beta-barrel domain-containing protein [Deltaproteobacteria bacterium]